MHQFYIRNFVNFTKRGIEIVSNIINIGFGNVALANRILAIVSPESAPIKRTIQEARDKGKLVDAT